MPGNLNKEICGILITFLVLKIGCIRTKPSSLSDNKKTLLQESKEECNEYYFRKEKEEGEYDIYIYKGKKEKSEALMENLKLNIGTQIYSEYIKETEREEKEKGKQGSYAEKIEEKVGAKSYAYFEDTETTSRKEGNCFVYTFKTPKRVIEKNKAIISMWGKAMTKDEIIEYYLSTWEFIITNDTHSTFRKLFSLYSSIEKKIEENEKVYVYFPHSSVKDNFFELLDDLKRNGFINYEKKKTK